MTAKLLGSQNVGTRPAVIREPLVRSVHSYAFAVLRLAAQRAGGPPPRLVTSAEQDAIIADLLAGEIADGPMRRRRGRPSCARPWVLPVSPPNYVSC